MVFFQNRKMNFQSELQLFLCFPINLQIFLLYFESSLFLDLGKNNFLCLKHENFVRIKFNKFEWMDKNSKEGQKQWFSKALDFYVRLFFNAFVRFHQIERKILKLKCRSLKLFLRKSAEKVISVLPLWFWYGRHRGTLGIIRRKCP